MNMEASLLQALANAQLRSTVDDCLRDMLQDVELSALLEDRLVTENEIQRLKAQLLERDWALEETKLLQKERAVKEHKLADDLVKELWSLSQQLGELKNIKKQHQELLVHYDEIIAKLMMTEEELQEARESNQRRSREEDEAKAADRGAVAEKSKSEIKEEEEKDTPPALTENLSGMTKESIPEQAKETDKAPESSAVAAENRGGTPVAESTQTPPAAISTEKKPPAADEPTKAPAPPAAVVTLEQDSEPETPTLDQLDNKILMIIFAYLDALDILNVAQINISMYSRVDSLFGLGNGEGDGDSSTIATNETAPSMQPTATTASVAASQPSTSTVQPGAAAATATGTIAAIPSKSASVATTTTTAAAAIKSRPVVTATDPQKHQNVVSPVNAANEGLRGILNMLQPGRKISGAPRSPLRNRSPATSSSSDSAPPMNAAMANSMAAKLSDAELNAIIVMTERLRQKEILAESLLKEREDLAAKLDGTESVKQFLIAKVRAMEEAIQAQEDNETKVAQQIASDQEVIAFLDGRVQELERQVTMLKKDQQDALNELARVKEQAEQKGIVMGDMLQFERERWNESEREWKATKKVLIKEVKTCRAQILSLQAERDGYREQNDLLRKAVLASPAAKVSLSRDQSFA